jgi:RNA polymerase sigma factor (sigma-70 family)
MDAMDTLLESHEQFIHRSVRSIDVPLSQDEKVQEGRIAFAYAVRTFDPKRAKNRLTTFASRCIFTATLKAAVNQNGPLQISVWTQNKGLFQRFGLDAIAEMPASGATPTEAFQLRADFTAAAAALDQIKPKEAVILRMRFGLDGGDPMRRSAVGKCFGVTSEAIRLVEQAGLKRIRRILTRPVACNGKSIGGIKITVSPNFSLLKAREVDNTTVECIPRPLSPTQRPVPPSMQ